MAPLANAPNPHAVCINHRRRLENCITSTFERTTCPERTPLLLVGAWNDVIMITQASAVRLRVAYHETRNSLAGSRPIFSLPPVNNSPKIRWHRSMRLRQCGYLAMVLASLALLDILQADDYSDFVKPLLRAKCVACHGGLKQEANLRLDTGRLAGQGGDSGPAVVGGDSSASLLWQRVTATDASERMPPDAEPLSASDLELLKRWIDAGAHWPPDEKPQANPQKHWAFQPLESVTIPAKPGLQPIDAFIQEKLAAEGLSQAPPADPHTLVRRLWLDVTGLPPTADSLQSWTDRLTHDPHAIAQLVELLLASPRHGERFAQLWLDVVRYADTHGFEVNTPRPNAWPYRDYVIRAINSDKPFNRFAAEQIAGEQLGEDAATGFLVAAAVLLPGQIGQDDASKRLARQDALDEVIIGTSATFFGLTIGCARCHDHKFDPISQRDYYALQAYFAGVEYGDREIVDEDAALRRKRAAELSARINSLTHELEQHQPQAEPERWQLIDDEDLPWVKHLVEKNGHGDNPSGGEPGKRDDVGDHQRSANVSRGRYTWWTNTPGLDVFTWNPAAHGRFRLWLSWGLHGSGVHTRDARYVLDLDGDLTSAADQREIARADQYYPAYVTTGETPQQPRWSGFWDAGIHDLEPATRLILRGGDSGTGITADAILLERVEADASASCSPTAPTLRAPVSPLRNVERFVAQKAQFVRFTTLETINDNQHEPCIDELEIFYSSGGSDSAANLALQPNVQVSASGTYPDSTQHQLAHINDGRYGNGRSWISNQRGGGWVQVQLAQESLIDTVAWGRDRDGQFQDRLPIRYQIEISIDGQNWITVANHSDRQPHGSPYDEAQTLTRLAVAKTDRSAKTGSGTEGTAAQFASVIKELEQLRIAKKEAETPKTVFAGVFRECDPTYLLNRGDAEQRLEEVGPRLPAIVATFATVTSLSDAQRRRALADWLEEPTSGLLARVIVNRVWQSHFGVGLVETASDFGLNGTPPSHPELLDWLARELIAHDWSLKWLERTILTSRTYQQSAGFHSAAMSKDADNRWLWRFPARRLPAEAIRDSVLQVSGHLNLEMGGPGFDFFKVRGGLTGFPPLEKFSGNELRRMIYAHKIRMERVPVFGVFDCPDAGQPSPKRSESTTPIQALNLFNSDFMAEQAEAFAARLVDAPASNPISVESPVSEESRSQQIDRAFEIALGRMPHDAERQAALDVVREHGLPVLCRVLFNSNEFLFLP